MDQLRAVGDPHLREALLLARGRDQPVTADELAAALGIHRNVARSRLERLVAAGLLASRYERRSGRAGPGAGRPAKTYAVEPALTSIEFPDRGYEELIGLLIEAVPPRVRTSRLFDAGAAFGRRLGRSGGVRAAKRPQTALEHVCRGLRRLGYQASVVSAEVDDVGSETSGCDLDHGDCRIRLVMPRRGF
jgi:predicted ArsR family transcriptional regulator